MLNRILAASLAAILLLATGIAVVGYLAYDAGPEAPVEVRTASVASTAHVSWGPDGDIRIVAESPEDALSALGFAHAARRAWSAHLWRQVALGRISEWAGEETIPVDRLARRLGISASARRAYMDLSESDRQRLQAYAAGFNEGMTQSKARRAAPFVLAGIEPEPWQPWHVIAVEKLLAWTTTDATRSGADIELRRLLRTFGSEYNAAAAFKSSDAPFLWIRLVTGASGLPLFEDVTIALGATGADHAATDHAATDHTATDDTVPGHGTFRGISMPGTLVFTAGTSTISAPGSSSVPSRSWAALLNSASATQPVTNPERWADEIRYDRVVTDSSEHAVRIARRNRNEALIVDSEDDAGFTSNRQVNPIAVRWEGLTARTDTPQWLALVFGESTPAFSMFDGGVLLAFGDRIEVLGRPARVVRAEDGSVLIAGRAAETGDPDGVIPAPRERFQQFAAQAGTPPSGGPPRAGTVLSDVLSPELDRRSERLLSQLPDSVITFDRVREAFDYLRNWNGSFSGTEIAPSILEALGGLADETDLPLTAAELEDAILLRLDGMAGRFGSDMSTWRWRRIQSRSLHFPGAEQLGLHERFSPVSVAAGGHSTTFVWAPPDILEPVTTRVAGSPGAAWEGVIAPASSTVLRRRPSIDWLGFLGAYLSAERTAEPGPIGSQPAEAATVLHPK